MKNVVTLLILLGAFKACTAQQEHKHKDSKDYPGHIIEDALIDNTVSKSATTLHGAVVLGDLLKVQEFIDEQGVDVNAQDTSLDTPLKLATQGKHYAVAQYLLQNRADANTEDQIGKVPLSYVAAFVDKDSRKLFAKLLIHNGASITKAGFEVGSPLYSEQTIDEFIGYEEATHEGRKSIKTMMNFNFTKKKNWLDKCLDRCKECTIL